MLHTHSQLWGANGCMEMSKNEIAILVDWNVSYRRPSCEGLITKIWTTPICFQQIFAPCLWHISTITRYGYLRYNRLIIFLVMRVLVVRLKKQSIHSLIKLLLCSAWRTRKAFFFYADIPFHNPYKWNRRQTTTYIQHVAFYSCRSINSIIVLIACHLPGKK